MNFINWLFNLEANFREYLVAHGDSLGYQISLNDTIFLQDISELYIYMYIFFHQGWYAFGWLFYPQYVFGMILSTLDFGESFYNPWIWGHALLLPIVSIIFYLIGRGLRAMGVCKNKNIDKPKLFYLLLKMIPFIGHFSVIFGALLSEKPNKKKHLGYVILGDILFICLGLIIVRIALYHYLYTRGNLMYPW